MPSNRLSAQITNSNCADDMMLFAKFVADFEKILSILKEELARIIHDIHESKTNIIMSFNKNDTDLVRIHDLMLKVMRYGKAQCHMAKPIHILLELYYDRVRGRMMRSQIASKLLGFLL